VDFDDTASDGDEAGSIGNGGEIVSFVDDSVKVASAASQKPNGPPDEVAYEKKTRSPLKGLAGLQTTPEVGRRGLSGRWPRSRSARSPKR
jgi:hypothetical protein